MYPKHAPPLELWAGVECTVNRIDARQLDQVARTGHQDRFADVDRLAALGARAVRYPILWERTAPDDLAHADFSWADARLARLRDHGLRVIAGLVHHGAGPLHTSLTDDAFPEKLAAYARAVATRYPWIDDFTPVNEPLTTARFSGLYGLWHPHRRDAAAFARALVQQCRGIALSMSAIREVNPRARLVQTEDMGTIFSTPRLAYQADFENERRWLSLDLLCGRVTREHPLWPHLAASVPPRELDAFAAAPCPPDVIGVNYYTTSDRFLDERLDRYPPHTHGGNERDAYADVEAVRVRAEGMVGHAACVEAAFRRYRVPVAITEVHVGCTREEQLRWLASAWRGAEDARARGVDVRAVTAWAAFGSVDWDSLLTRDAGRYEPGVYDVRAPEPRATALVALARELGEHGRGSHPVLAAPGWWESPRRFTYGVPPVDGIERTSRPEGHARPILVVGAKGLLGAAFVRACAERGLACAARTRAEIDIAEPDAVARALDDLAPWAVVNAAGYSRVGEAERDRSRCHRDNAWGAAALAAACAGRGIALVTFSSDLVFDGARRAPYVESDPIAPLGVYGCSKAWAERAVLERCPGALVVRTSRCFGGGERRSFVHRAVAALEARRPFRAAEDRVVSAAFLPDLVRVTLDLLIDGERGVWHLVNDGALSVHDLARRASAACGVPSRSLVACTNGRARGTTPLPPYSALASERARLMPPLDDALERYARERIHDDDAGNEAGAA